jgi:outer membrane protein OmpA-like peptidoglycan-associated protein
MFKTSIVSACVVSLLAVGLLPRTLGAAEMRYYAEGKVPAPIEVARALVGTGFKPHLKKRGVQTIGADARDAVLLAELAGQSTTTSAPGTETAAEGFAIAIPFAFNSAILEPAAHEALDNIAEGIKLVQSQGAVVIEGHTDAKGADSYNLKLSARRAASVKRYLTRTHGISGKQLQVIGKGRLELLNPNDPFAPENRRVQFRMAS